MSTRPSTPKYRLYPAYCFRASPTFDAWVKLTAADIQALRYEPEFPGQQIYFHLNHPIRYVCLVGVVVAIEDINARYTVLTVDDGSGATIEVKIVRITPDVYDPETNPSNTTVANINVISRIGVFEVSIDGHSLDIGTVVKAKGTLSEFRGAKQLELKRITVVSSTDKEAKAWADAAAYKRNVLAKPWHLSSAEHRKIKSDLKSEKQRNRNYELRKAEYDAKKQKHRDARAQYMAQRKVKLEARRRKEEVMMNAGALI
ncbi:hypothetical protein BS50DRAFT_514836 [Corynespora cassiicola Philippines]|uniref:CST complex subunit STN1 n=1 Tax=Corynespora cassiicola Philippines TaxID=1448308 RepID=A0A2T2P7C4_CORCC|nr:hypothetical protein BS50DRAFT_514836 [Corynespora cassiicola Philippines]